MKPYPDIVRGHSEVPGDLRDGFLVDLDPPEQVGVRRPNLAERHDDAAAWPVVKLLREGPGELLVPGPARTHAALSPESAHVVDGGVAQQLLKPGQRLLVMPDRAGCAKRAHVSFLEDLLGILSAA
jgi:hypothetical protein